MSEVARVPLSASDFLSGLEVNPVFSEVNIRVMTGFLYGVKKNRYGSICSATAVHMSGRYWPAE